MEEAFGVVIIVVTAIAAVIAVIALLMAPKAYEQIGRGGLSLRDSDEDGPGEGRKQPRETPPAVRDDEIRQMLTARNERRARRGEAPVDVEAEMQRLTAVSTAADPGLREEVRQHVVARNERRKRKGLEALDVDAEVERQLGELSG
jgi:hypothetical protein